jgi:hypothetical protein
VFQEASVGSDEVGDAMKLHAESTSMGTGLQIGWDSKFLGCDPGDTVVHYHGFEPENCDPLPSPKRLNAADLTAFGQGCWSSRDPRAEDDRLLVPNATAINS